MKTDELLTEWPFHLKGDYVPHVEQRSRPSLEGLKREMITLGTLILENVEFKLKLVIRI